MKTRVLILGSTGMLGSTLRSVLSVSKTMQVETTARNGSAHRNFDAEDFLVNPRAYGWLREYDYILNAIGIIKPFCKDDDNLGCSRAIRLNGLFPRVLADFLEGNSARVIQIATDCVYSGSRGSYDESAPHDAHDLYGKSKSLGEIRDPRMLHLRCSIIGREQSSKLSLLEWFLSQPKGSALDGYDHHLWNGVTALQYAELCGKIIDGGHFDRLRNDSPVHHFVPNETVSKYQLLNMFRDVFEHEVSIRRIQRPLDAINRTLSSKFSVLEALSPKSSMLEEIRRLR